MIKFVCYVRYKIAAWNESGSPEIQPSLIETQIHTKVAFEVPILRVEAQAL